MSRGVVDFERAVVSRCDGFGGVGQDASSRLLAPSTSLVSSSSATRSSSAMAPLLAATPQGHRATGKTQEPYGAPEI